MEPPHITLSTPILDNSPDHSLFLWINGLSGVPAIDSAMKVIGSDYFMPVTMLLIVFGFWFGGRSVLQRERNQWGVIYGMIGVGFSNLIIHVLNRVLDFNLWPRPFLAMPPPQTNLLFYPPPDPSFPSNSAAVAFAFTTGMFLYNRKGGIFIGCLALLCGFSRIYIGIHFPLDILAGALIGIITTLIFYKIVPLCEPLPTMLLRIPKLLHLSDIPVSEKVNKGIFLRKKEHK